MSVHPSRSTAATCNPSRDMLWSGGVIKAFRHKGLQRFFETGDKKGIQPRHANQLRDILTALDSATSPRDMGAPNFRLHLLEPRRADIWSVYVAKNWSVDFRFIGGHAEMVDYVDHH